MKIRIDQRKLTDSESDQLLENLGLSFLKKYKVNFVFSEECIQDIEIRNHIVKKLLEDPINPEDIKVWQEIDVKLKEFFATNKYEKIRDQLKFVAFDWEKGKDIEENRENNYYSDDFSVDKWIDCF